MFSSCYYGNKNFTFRARQKDDYYADTVYELFGKDSNLCVFYCSILPTKWNNSNDWSLFYGNNSCNIVRISIRQTKFKGEPVPFVMELPNYRMPGAKSVLRLIWDKAKDFITRAFTVIFIASLIIWFLQTFSITFNIVSDSKDSILALIGGVIAPIFAPLGFGDWRASTALITGFTAKESVVSTMTVLLGGSPVATMFNTHNAIGFLVFTLWYTPVVAAITSVKRELGGKWAIAVVLWQCLVAWVAAFLVHGIGMLLG